MKATNIYFYSGMCLACMLVRPVLGAGELTPAKDSADSATAAGIAIMSGAVALEDGDDAPFLVHDGGAPDSTAPCSGYVDPRLETLRGADLNVGIRQVTLVFSEEVFGIGGKPLGPEDFPVTETGITFGIDESQEPLSGTGSEAFGVGNVTLNDDQTELTIHIEHDLTAVTVGHIHSGASGTNGAVAFPFDDPTSPIDAVWSLSPADVDDLEAGLLYVNLHSDAFPNGEIRGQIVPNRVIEVDAQNNPQVNLTLLRPPSLEEWTTIQAVVEDAAGMAILNQGNLGPGVDEPDRVDYAFLPADIDQDEDVRPLDLLRFRQGLSGLHTPRCGEMADYLDTDRNGIIEGFDLVRYRQLIFGTGPTTKPWAFETNNHPRP